MEINQNGLFSSSNGLVTIRDNGYYYVYMSVAAQSGQVSDSNVIYSTDCQSVCIRSIVFLCAARATQIT